MYMHVYIYIHAYTHILRINKYVCLLVQIDSCHWPYSLPKGVSELQRHHILNVFNDHIEDNYTSVKYKTLILINSFNTY